MPLVGYQIRYQVPAHGALRSSRLHCGARQAPSTSAEPSNAELCEPAEDAARELPNLSLEDALLLVYVYAERESPKREPAARRWLARYLTEGSPGLLDIAQVSASLTTLRVD